MTRVAAARRDAIPADDRIASVAVATVGAALAEPIRFGDWVLREREYAIVRLVARSGAFGHAVTLTRDGPLAAVIRRTVAPHYAGRPLRDPEAAFAAARRSAPAILSSGIGLRALSLVDLAAWDLAARAAGLPVEELLAGAPGAPSPATAIVGYPPALGGEAVAAEVAALHAAGWRRFKLPIAATPALNRQRVHAAAAAAPDAPIALDGAWALADVDAALALLAAVDHPLEWFEDVFAPGDAGIVRALRDRTEVPIAMGDEQGGAYFPEALIAARAVDVVRVDATCMGGLSALPAIIARVRDAGLRLAPHMFGHVHARLLPALGAHGAPIEWGLPGSGVDPWSDALAPPTIGPGGLMEPLPAEPGFGALVNPAWLAEQRLEDPDGLVGALS